MFFFVMKGHIMLLKTCTPSSVLLVCLGSICRSPTAEEIFRQQAAIAGLSIKVDSAGTSDGHVALHLTSAHNDMQSRTVIK